MTEVVQDGLASWWAPVVALGLAILALLGATVAQAVATPEGRRSSAALVPVQEVARLLRQRRRTTPAADLLLWRAATTLWLPLALMMVAFVPWGDQPLVGSSVGVVWFNALDVVAWAVLWLAGWGANSVYALVGGYRFLATALAYELPLMFALVAPAVAAGSLDLAVIADAQAGLWYVVWMPVAFAAYCLGVLGFSARPPLDAAAHGDLGGGVLAELSGVDRLLALAGRYALLAAGATVAVPLFLGGGSGPLLPGWLWVGLKAAVLTAALAATGRWVPTLRPDRLLQLGWVVVLPLVVAQDLVVSIVVVSR